LKYVDISDKQYVNEFLLIGSTFKEIISDESFDVMVMLIKANIN